MKCGHVVRERGNLEPFPCNFPVREKPREIRDEIEIKPLKHCVYKGCEIDSKIIYIIGNSNFAFRKYYLIAKNFNKSVDFYEKRLEMNMLQRSAILLRKNNSLLTLMRIHNIINYTSGTSNTNYADIKKTDSTGDIIR